MIPTGKPGQILYPDNMLDHIPSIPSFNAPLTYIGLCFVFPQFYALLYCRKFSADVARC
jgi:hypothetical protein